MLPAEVNNGKTSVRVPLSVISYGSRCAPYESLSIAQPFVLLHHARYGEGSARDQGESKTSTQV